MNTNHLSSILSIQITDLIQIITIQVILPLSYLESNNKNQSHLTIVVIFTLFRSENLEWKSRVSKKKNLYWLIKSVLMRGVLDFHQLIIKRLYKFIESRLIVSKFRLLNWPNSIIAVDMMENRPIFVNRFSILPKLLDNMNSS